MPTTFEYKVSLKIDGREWLRDPLVGRIEADALRTFELTVPAVSAVTVYPNPDAATDPVPALSARALVLVPTHACSFIKLTTLENIGVLSPGAPFIIFTSELDTIHDYAIQNDADYDIGVKGMVLG